MSQPININNCIYSSLMTRSMHHSQSVLLFYHILGDYYSLCTVSFVMFITRAQHAGGLCVCFCMCADRCKIPGPYFRF